MHRCLIVTFLVAVVASETTPKPAAKERSPLIKRLFAYKLISVSSSHRHLLSTDNDSGGHPESIDFNFDHESKTHHVQLKKNHELFHPDYHIIREKYSDDPIPKLISSTKEKMPKEKNCFYRGHVQNADTFLSLAVHTCFEGVTGQIKLNGEALFIEPAKYHLPASELLDYLDDSGNKPVRAALHILYKLSDYDHGLKEGDHFCGIKDNSSHSHIDHDHDHTHADHDNAHHDHHDLDKTYFQDLPYLYAKHKQEHQRRLAQDGPVSRIVELLVVNDHAFKQKHSSQTEITTASIVNTVALNYESDDLLKAVADVSIRLVAQITWETPPFPVVLGQCDECTDTEVSVESYLADFNIYSQDQARPHHDNAQLFSGLDFESVVLGFAAVRGMCNNRASGINEMRNSDDGFNAAIVTHEMGHNFGMLHDSSTNDCQPSGFFMNAIVQARAPEDFSTCSIEYFNYYAIDYLSGPRDCLDNKPTIQWGDPVCGNDFLEGPEECDCGSTSAEDACCDCATCQLKPRASCSPISSECCTDDCAIKNAGIICRDKPLNNMCDLAETCDGVSPQCPEDLKTGPGTECVNEESIPGVCLFGECVSHQAQCMAFGAEYQTEVGFDACPKSKQIQFNDGEFCAVAYCEQPGTQCSWFSSAGQKVTINDGVECELDNKQRGQCKDQKCVTSDQLVSNPYWAGDEFTYCNDCTALQYRNISCKYKDLNGKIQNLADEYCPPYAKIPTERKCINPELGCVHDVGLFTDENDIQFLGFEVTKQTIYLVFGGTLAVGCICLLCCYQAVTFGGYHKLDEEDYKV